MTSLMIDRRFGAYVRTYLPHGDNGKKADEADEEVEAHHPNQGRLTDVPPDGVSGVDFLGRPVVHGQQIRPEPP